MLLGQTTDEKRPTMDRLKKYINN